MQFFVSKCQNPSFNCRVAGGHVLGRDMCLSWSHADGMTGKKQRLNAGKLCTKRKLYIITYIYNIHATYIVLPFRVLDELGGATFASDTIIFQDLAGKLVVSSMYCNSMLICKLERP